MKPLELTKSHREKLLEMCKKLFPEYDIEFYKDITDAGWEDDYLSVIANDKSSRACIHWFEFCMTHLAYKLAACDNEEMFIGDNYRVYDKVMDNKNPVDYLYEQFKKIK